MKEKRLLRCVKELVPMCLVLRTLHYLHIKHVTLDEDPLRLKRVLCTNNIM